MEQRPPSAPRRPTARALPWLPVLLFAACGGGGGGGGSATLPANLSGTIRVPSVPPARLPAGSARAPMAPGEVVVWLDDSGNPPDLSAQGLELLRAPGGPIAVYRANAALAKPSLRDGAPEALSQEQATCDAAELAATAPGVRCASPNFLYQPTVQPNDPFFGLQWHYPQINLPQAWNLTQGSTNVVVAVLDTGIKSQHPEFAGRLVPGFDMISDPAAARDGNGRDPNPEDAGDLATPQGSSFHGTHVAGTIGANGNDGQGIAGVDWNCKLMPVRVLGQGGGSVQDIADGILFAARLANGSGQLPAQRADIINMSLGGPGLSPVMEQACNQAAAAGVLLVAAAGNDNSDQPNSPAAFASVLSVGAVDLIRQRAPYSNFHTSVDLWAPGGDMSVDRNGDQRPDGVLSCMADDQGQFFFAFENGTSMAAPHVAGVAALLKARDPSLTAAQLRQALLGTATPGQGLPNNGRVVDALAALQAVGGGTGGVPLLVATATTVDFDTALTEIPVGLENRGAGTLAFESATFAPAAPWLQVAMVAPTTPGNLDRVRADFTASRAGLANGVYRTRCTLLFRNGTQPVTLGIDVRLQVGQNQTSNDTVFVLLLDPDTLETRFQTATTAANQFRYNLGNVPAGDYVLVAGTDRDNDDFLGDPGELFGAWPSLDTPLILSLTGGQTVASLDFALEDLVVLQSVRAGGLPFAVRRLP